MISFTRAGIVHARELHQDLILAQSVLLNDRLADAQLVNAVADGLNGQRHRAVLQFSQGLRLHGEGP